MTWGFSAELVRLSMLSRFSQLVALPAVRWRLPSSRPASTCWHACAKATFAEQVPGLTIRYGRRTCGLDGVLQAVAMALGGRAGARLTGRLACAVSRSTLIRVIRAAPTAFSISGVAIMVAWPPSTGPMSLCGRGEGR